MTRYEKMLNEEGCPECTSDDTYGTKATVNDKDDVAVCVCNECGHTVERDEEKNRILEALKSKAENCLDEIVYETCCAEACSAANLDSDEESDGHIEEGEKNASAINNLGLEGQITWLLKLGVTEEEIIKAAD